VHVAAPVHQVRRTAGGWSVETESGPHQADRVVLAADGGAARTLLAPLLPGLLDEWPLPHRTAVVSLVVDAPRLDAAPRGTGVLVARGVDEVRANALTHSTAKWPWLASRLPAHRHALRLSYRGDAADGADETAALSDAAALLGVGAGDLDPVGSTVTLWSQESQRALTGMRKRIESVRDAARALPGLEVTGAWVAGTGLASVIADADHAGRAA
jgi:oxygen-dependent protoporphyrinogen oxidase